MSTKFTIDNTVGLNDEPLGQALINASQWLGESLLSLMAEQGHSDLTNAHLTFFCHLNCGVTQASEVARRMGISRQAVYKVTQELQRLGALELQEDPENKRRKIICMTDLGERIALDARVALEEVEQHLKETIGTKNFEAMAEILRLDWGPHIGASKEETG